MKKAQIFTPITLMFMLLCFAIVWILFLGNFLNLGVSMAMNGGYYTGVEAFIISNFNFIVFLVLMASAIAVGVYSANQ